MAPPVAVRIGNDFSFATVVVVAVFLAELLGTETVRA